MPQYLVSENRICHKLRTSVRHLNSASNSPDSLDNPSRKYRPCTYQGGKWPGIDLTCTGTYIEKPPTRVYKTFPFQQRVTAPSRFLFSLFSFINNLRYQDSLLTKEKLYLHYIVITMLSEGIAPGLTDCFDSYDISHR